MNAQSKITVVKNLIHQLLSKPEIERFPKEKLDILKNFIDDKASISSALSVISEIRVSLVT